MPTDDFAIEIRSFDPALHGRDQFDCGNDRLNNFLKLSAKRQQRGDMTRVYVALRQGQSDILGYHAINGGSMNVDQLENKPRGVPSHGALPVLFLGQIAVSRHAQGQGIGSILMHHVFQKAAVVADSIGCFAILLDVMRDGGDAAFEQRKAWYEAFGFQTMPSNEARMFMTLKDVRASLSV